MLWFEISKMLIVVFFENKLIVLFIMIVGSLSFPVGFAWLRLARALYMVSAAPRISTKVDSWWIGLTKTRGLDRGAWHCKQRPGIHLHGHVEAGNINPPPTQQTPHRCGE